MATGRTNACAKQEDFKYKITTAELPNTTINLSLGGSIVQTKTTDSTTGGKVSFDITDTGTYTVTALNGDTELWSNTVVVDNIGEYIVKSGKALNNYTPAEMHTALQGGYFSTMFNLKDSITLIKTNNILNNYKFFVEQISQTSDEKEIVDFRMASTYSSSYQINERYAYLASAEATSWSIKASNIGGYKYCKVRQTMMETADIIYMQATGIKPDNSTISDGILFSQIKYTNNGNVSPVYSYDRATDTMTAVTTWQDMEAGGTYFVKGYFKNVGTIDEETFNNGIYYTYSSNIYVYTPAITYINGTTYYGFYETLQEDGIFVNALKTSDFGSNLVKFNDKASAGGIDSYTNEFSDYVDISACEEITGINKDTILMSGKAATNIHSYNISGEGLKKPSYDEFSIQTVGDSYWTRSASTYASWYFCLISLYGEIISSYQVFNPGSLRLGFRLG